MERNCNINEITDGRLYGLNDMVKASCNDCEGCSACCHGMGDSIVLDPLDIHRLSVHLNMSFEELLQNKVELGMVDGLILPHLKMQAETESCGFLNEEGRCSVHPARPGICRIFPLGRLYEDRSFNYVLQVNECQKPNRTKVKVSKWIDTKNLSKNESFINEWHYLLKDIAAELMNSGNETMMKQMSMYLIQKFYKTPYDEERDFYDQFEERYNKTKELFF